MAAQKNSLQMERRNPGIHSCGPLRHPVIAGVLGFEREFVKGPGTRAEVSRTKWPPTPRSDGNPPQCRTSVADQPNRTSS